ncbi:hypothetical protein J31TS4_22540 [Paenibacillus sp. J31TS4]|uniref:phosphotransferase family protein n=1 Tax=Paenibacillus sp. J31TS4 TaxID=2807195 RepID=UPI001B1F0741|nr:phosphotransferase [Paenibacillus sp. J31TS4]GIP38974.1 hypothetical protein J31TS4_22540 [Paenibacillus sp. J31TS4]
MKENWERTNSELLELAETQQLAEAAFGPEAQVVEAERLGEGFSNTNYKLRLQGHADPYVLRLYRSGPETAEKERAIARLVEERVPTARFVYLDSSGTHRERPWAILEWKRGTLLKEVLKSGDEEEKEQAAVSVGEVLAGIHAFGFKQAGLLDGALSIREEFPMNEGNFLAFLEESLFRGKAGVWLGDRQRDELWAWSRAHASLLAEQSGPPALIHSDFNGPNVLVDREEPGCPVTAVLDWEFAFSGSPMADIGNLLRYEPRGSRFTEAFLGSYEQHGGRLPADWELRSRLEDLVALCDMLNHCTEDTPVRIRDLIGRIERTLADYPLAIKEENGWV